MKRTSLWAGAGLSLILVSAALVQSQPVRADETNPQTSATTTVKAPAGVSNQPAMQNDTQGMKGAQTECQSASAEMTNGAVESCKK